MLHQLCYGLGKFSFSVHRNASATSSEWFSRTFGSTVEGLHQSVHFVFMSLDGFLIEDMLVDCDRLRPQQFNTVDLSVEIRVFQSPETEDVQLDSDAFVFLTCTPPPPSPPAPFTHQQEWWTPQLNQCKQYYIDEVECLECTPQSS